MNSGLFLTALTGLLLSGCSLLFPSKPKADIFDTGLQQDFILVMEHQELTRMATIHLPDGYRESGNYPLVLVLHGGGGNGGNAKEMTGMNKVADKNGFIVVYPNGTGKLNNRLLTWNAGDCCGYAQENQIDDVGFLSALIDTLGHRFQVNQKKVFATGMSNGGMMAYRLAYERPDVIAAIAPVGATMAMNQISPKGPVSVLAINGMKDLHVPYEGGIGPESIVKQDWRPVEESVMTWVKANQCNPVPVVDTKPAYRIDTYFSQNRFYEVALVTVFEGGHAWPGGEKGFILGDKPEPEPNASQLIWEFFSRHSRP
ncbi:MAG: prolyl oligopeptidase family serine peptidase [Bacteroidetes bacterium]|nr:prolyl oligopeptidase family serine peptidase [Bacteroidota bacterium]